VASDVFLEATEGQQNWAIRAGAEPFDFHGFVAKGTAWDRFVEDNLGITAGIGSIANTNYLEVGTIDAKGDFHVAKRIHAMGLSENWEMDGGESRLVVFAVDGKYTPFTADTPEGEKYEGDLIQRDDPNALKPNELQHSRDEVTTLGDVIGVGDPEENDYSRIIFQGTEREVLELYGGMLDAVIELNNKDPEEMGFKLFTRNSNAVNSEMKEKMGEMAKALGIDPERIAQHDAVGIDFGRDHALDTQTASPVRTWDSIEDVRAGIDAREQAAASQLDTMRNEGTFTPLNTPLPSTGGASSP